MDVGRTLGYGGMKSWLVGVAPLLQRQIRLPMAATFVYGCTNVDLALPLGPQTPPPLAMILWQWFTSSRLEDAGVAYAGGVLLVGGMLLGMMTIGVLGRGLRFLPLRCATDGRRATRDAWARGLSMTSVHLVGALALGAVVALLLRAATPMWRFPAVWPMLTATHGTLETLWPNPATVERTTGLALAVAAASVALAWWLAEWSRAVPARRHLVTLVVFLPLLMPQVLLLFGLSWVAVALPWMPDLAWVAWTHVGFALPYAWGVLSPARRMLDERYLQVAATLGAGTGHVATLATDAAAATTAGTLHVAARSAISLALLPLLAFALTSIASRVLYGRFRGVPQ